MDELFTTLLDHTNPLYKIILGIGLGIFIGLRREYDRLSKNKGHHIKADILGIRTTTLIIILGIVATFFDDMPLIRILIFLSVLIMLIIAYINGVWKLKRYGLTAEISGILMFLIGMLIGNEKVFEAVLLSIVLGASVAYKSSIHRFAQNFSLKEWSGTLQMLVISAIILPLLPDTPIDPYGIIVPFDIWILVIFISGISFVGYFFSKYFGKKKSILFTSFFGALASSTATTTALARESKMIPKEKVEVIFLLVGMMIAIGVMQLRVLMTIIVIAPQNYSQIIVPPLMMAIVSFTFAIAYFIRLPKEKANNRAKSFEHSKRSPFEIIPALYFTAFFVLILFMIHFGQSILGNVGVYISAFLASFADVDAVVFTSLLSLEKTSLTLQTTIYVIVIATTVNTIVKILYIFLFGSRTFFRKSLFPIVLITLTGIATVFFL